MSKIYLFTLVVFLGLFVLPRGVLSQSLNICPKPCGSNGVCGENGVCLCNDGWDGDDCTLPDFGAKHCLNDCSGNGECLKGNCKCNPGFITIDCSQKDPCYQVNCNGRGSCSKGACVCNPGFIGTDCGQTDPCYNKVCLNDGVCQGGLCVCKSGFLGADCGVKDPCFGVSCKNGGTCSNGVCSCPAGFLGADCGVKDPCFGVVCRNGGSCSQGQCICSAGFLGADCGTRDPCFGVSCKNGGSCSNGVCACLAGFLGADCGVKDPCFGVSCKNGGTCSNGVCSCAAGFLGADCGVKDPCFGVVCRNGGSCSQGRCNCPAGFLGADCGTRDPCFGVSCKNGGSCSNGVCSCPAGFLGADCGVRDPCFGVVCRNGGSCSQGRCNCPAGFLGADCGVKDPCFGVSCRNGGSCSNGACICPAGFLGSQCETRDPCFGVNCQNGGRCSNGVCQCAPRFAGANCELATVRENPILSAFYGTLDVTSRVQSMYDQGQRTFVATNSVWGDPNVGIRKVLIVIYQEGAQVKHVVADEWNQFFSNQLTLPQLADPTSYVTGPVVYAVYGSKDVTAEARRLYSQKREVFESCNCIWGDPNWGLQKWMYIFYLEQGQIIRGKGAYEYGHKSKPDRADSPIGQVVFRHSPILSAFYGSKDVTADVQAKYAQGVRRFYAHNSWWGDPNPGTRKVLVIVYQENTVARVLVSDEWGRFNQNYLDLPSLGIPMLKLSRNYIVSAVYGSKDITDQVTARYNSNRFMMASNSYWGDPNYGHEKWLYIFYLWGDQVKGVAAYEYGFLFPVKMFWLP